METKTNMAKIKKTPHDVPSLAVRQIARLYEGLNLDERKKVLLILQGIDSDSVFRAVAKKRNDAETAEEKMPQKRQHAQN